MIDRSFFKLTEIQYNPDGSYNIFDRHGVRFVFAQTGTIGIFNFLAFINNVVAALAMFSIAGVLVDYIMIYFLPNRKNYSEAKFEGISF